MTRPSPPIVDLHTLTRGLFTYWFRWTLPLVVFTLVALGYALVRPATWEVSQALLVRDEAIGNFSRAGRFDELEFMKSAQETVLQLARSRTTIAAALRDVGPRTGTTAASWPSAADVIGARDSIQVAAPNGAAFGSTEVFHIKVTDCDKHWAVDFATALCQQIDTQLSQLRDSKGQSLVDELTKTVDLAQVDLDEATSRLARIEEEVGSDLAELRILNESASGASNLRQTLIELKNEVRHAEIEHQANKQLLDMLEAAQRDPSQLIATPNRLLDSQPSLRQLKDGLVASKLKTAQLLGELSNRHPKVKASLAAQQEIRSNLHNELHSAIAGLQAELNLGNARVADLRDEVQNIESRMNRLAKLRASYGNLVTEVRQRGQTLSTAQANLSEARASQAAAHSASLLTLLELPTISDYPVGPSRTMIVLCGLFAGLATGFGIVLLTVPLDHLDRTPVSSPAVTVSPPSNPPASEKHTPVGLSLKQALSRIAQFAPSRN